MVDVLRRDKSSAATDEVDGVPVVSVSAPRRRRGSLMVVGGLLVVVGALVAAWLVASAQETHRVLVAARELTPGVVVGEADVRVVEVGGASLDVASVSADDQSQVVGRFPGGVIPAGSMLNPAMFVGGDEVVPVGSVLVGVLLGEGALPVDGVRVGDEVSLISVATVDKGDPSVIVVVPAPSARGLRPGSCTRC